jgi:iron complex transport system substrate-binding protein
MFTKMACARTYRFPLTFAAVLTALLATILATTLLASCSGEKPQEYQHDKNIYVDALGRHLDIQNPKRIVSLSPAITEILFAIDAGERVVGVTIHCDYPMAIEEKVKAGAITRVGGFSGATVSIEQIHALNPDLVLLSADMHARIVAVLDAIGIASFAVEPKNFSQTYELIILLAEILGDTPAGEKVVAEMQEKIAAVSERVKNLATQRVFWILSNEPLMTAGGGTFITNAITLAGGQNIFAERSEQWPLISPEQALVQRPDWVLLASDMGETAAVFRSPLWQQFAAVREGRTAIVSGDLLYRYGPRLADAVVSIAAILHGEVDEL